MSDCDATDMRDWHNARLIELNYPASLVFELASNRDDWMGRNEMLCCKTRTGSQN